MSTPNSRRSSLVQLWKENHVFSINIVCPDNKSVSKVHSIKETVNDVFKSLCENLLIDTPDIFGLATYEHNEYRFLSLRTTLSKILPSTSSLTAERAAKVNDDYVSVLDDKTSTNKTDFFLRVKHFYINVDILSGRSLYYYYEQIRLDSLKYQDWLHVCGYTDVFYNMASYSLWLTYGPKIVRQLEGKGYVDVQTHLPRCEWTDDSIEIIQDKLGRLNDDMEVDNNDESEVSATSEAFEHVTLNVVDTEVRNSKTKENKTLRRSTQEFIMQSLIKESLKLPFYGTHYYHVSCIRDDGLRLTNCKLGVGPFGISATSSTDYTTWEEFERLNWTSVDDVKLEKNELYIHERSGEKNVNVVHQFQCVDEKEAKYLRNFIEETNWFQKNTLERQRACKKSKPYSLSLLSTESASVFITPVMSRSASLTMLNNSFQLQKEKDSSEEATVVGY